MSRRWEKLLSRQVGRTAQLRERDAAGAGRSSFRQAVDVLSERRLKFTADHAVGYAVEEVVLVKRSVEPEVGDVALRIQTPGPAHRPLTPSRIAVCMGVEIPTKSARRTLASSRTSTARSRHST